MVAILAEFGIVDLRSPFPQRRVSIIPSVAGFVIN
jgi:hypothetical protein